MKILRLECQKPNKENIKQQNKFNIMLQRNTKKMLMEY